MCRCIRLRRRTSSALRSRWPAPIPFKQSTLSFSQIRVHLPFSNPFPPDLRRPTTMVDVALCTAFFPPRHAIRLFRSLFQPIGDIPISIFFASGDPPYWRRDRGALLLFLPVWLPLRLLFFSFIVRPAWANSHARDFLEPLPSSKLRSLFRSCLASYFSFPLSLSCLTISFFFSWMVASRFLSLRGAGRRPFPCRSTQIFRPLFRADLFRPSPLLATHRGGLGQRFRSTSGQSCFPRPATKQRTR